MKVYYNSACPVCNAGITTQKNRLSECKIEWNDIHEDHENRDDLDADLEFVRKRLHIIDDNGELQVGIDALRSIWAQSARTKPLAKIVGLRVIHQLANVSYNSFAAVLYKTNRYLGRW